MNRLVLLVCEYFLIYILHAIIFILGLIYLGLKPAIFDISLGLLDHIIPEAD